MIDNKKTPFTKIGQKYHQFEVVQIQRFPEIRCRLIELVHLPTEAHVMHLENDDPENLFCLSFRTLPNCSNGVAHILEHTVLCGSEKFPVKDPFFAMTRRSLNTFMNALTGSDFTCYPAATQVEQDFYNLLEVYLDAVFHPLLKHQSFLQEGWRLEFHDPKDPKSPLEYKGVVYNEMKGALASPSTRIHEALRKELFPDLTYGINSGGNPQCIPSLTYEELISFHQTYYHPSRCLFFFYGNFPLKAHLDFIAEKTLSSVHNKLPLLPLPLQKRMSKPKSINLSYPSSGDADSEKSWIGMGWLTCHILKQEELLALSILVDALLGTDAAPLKHAILKSGLCGQVQSYLESEISEVPFILLMKGCESKDADTLQTLLFQTLKRIYNEGLPPYMIDNAMHQLEFERTEIVEDHAPYGLTLFFRSALLKQHGGKAEDGLRIHSLFDCLRSQIKKEPKYINQLIKKYFLDNPHFVRIVMNPDPELSKKEEDEEHKALEAIRKKMTQPAVDQIIKQTKELNQFQKKQEHVDKNVLPKIHLSDVPRDSRDFLIEKEKFGEIPLFFHECFTNEILYVDFVYNIPMIDDKDLPYLRLLTLLLPQIGFGDKNYMQSLEEIQANTGGVSVGLSLNHQADNSKQFHPYLVIHGKALYRKANKLFDILFEMATSSDFSDGQRLEELIKIHTTSLKTGLQSNAIRYAINLSARGLNTGANISDKWYGLQYYQEMIALEKTLKGSLSSFQEKLKKLYQLVLNASPQIVITCDKKMRKKILTQSYLKNRTYPKTVLPQWQPTCQLPKDHAQGRIISSPVAFSAKVIPSLSYIHPDSPVLAVITQLLNNRYLHQCIREEGGAYGGGCDNHSLSGYFCFYAYRDPNISKSFQAFDDSVNDLLLNKFSEDEIEEAKLEVIQGLDSPISPGLRGFVAYSWYRQERTLQKRQNFRNQLFSVSREDIIRVAKDNLLPLLNQGIPVTFSGKEHLEKENKKLKLKGFPALKIENILTSNLKAN